MITLPSDFVTRTRELLGEQDFNRLEAALETESPVSIRLNPGKPVPELTAEQIPWSDTGYYLPERLSFTFDPLFHAGLYYVQEASSMFLEQAIRQYISTPVKCLDLCAAPGGKSTHLSTVLPEGSLLVSNEVIRSRSHILAENTMKWGNPAVIVTNNDPEEIGRLTHLFDVVVTDVPCSGEGMFRKDPDSRSEWSLANVNLCASRQRRIIHNVWNALKPGGFLIYSTCTYNTEENEENIHYITEELGATPLPVSIDENWNITSALKYNYPVYRFFPHKTKGEGFFLAILQKEEGETETIRHKFKGKNDKKKKLPLFSEKQPAFWKKEGAFLKKEGVFSIETTGDFTRAFPLDYQYVHTVIQNHLRIVSSGIHMGEIKGKDWIPNQSLALSTAFNPDSFPSVELSWNEAIRFLQREAIVLPENTEKGYVLVTFKGHPLGFVKNLGNRSNNLYPQEWRIRSGYLPSEEKTLL